MNITPVFNQVLASHNARPVEPYVFRVENLDEFVKEAYRIVGHVTRHSLGVDANDCDSVHTSPSCTQTSSQYGKATSLQHLRHAESSLRAPATARRPQTKIRSTSPTRNATRSTRKQSSRCGSSTMQSTFYKRPKEYGRARCPR